MSAVMGVVQCGHFADKGCLQMRMFVLFSAKKTLDFSKFMVYPHRQRGVESVWRFCRQGRRGPIFRDFLDEPLFFMDGWTFFMDGPIFLISHY